MIRYMAEGGLLTEDDKGDPIAISHLALVTLVKGLKGDLVVHESVNKDGGTSTTYEARLGYLRLFFEVTEEKKGAQAGGSFEIILPHARYMRDPLLPEGAKPLPMRILGQDPAKALPAA